MTDQSSGSHEEPHDHTNPMEGPALGGRSSNDPKLRPVRPKIALYWSLYAACVLAYLIIFSIGKGHWNTILFSFPLFGMELKFGLGALINLIPLAHIAASLKKVHTDEVAGKYFYGVPLFRARPGLNFVPFGIMNLERYPADIQEIFLPAKADEIFWGDEEQPLPEGMVRPIWVPTKPPTDVEQAPLDAQMVVGIVGYLFWRITDIFTFHARVTSVEEADSQLRSIWVRVASEDIVKHTAGGAIAKQQELNDNLDNRIRGHTSDWGIQATSAGLTQINVSHALGAAMRNRAKARFEAETKVIDANAEGEARERLGKADGEADRARTAGPLMGRADGLAAMAKSLGVDGSVVLAADTAPRIFEHADVIVAGAESGLKDVMAAATAVVKGVTKTSGGAGAKAS